MVKAIQVIAICTVALGAYVYIAVLPYNRLKEFYEKKCQMRRGGDEPCAFFTCMFWPISLALAVPVFLVVVIPARAAWRTPERWKAHKKKRGEKGAVDKEELRAALGLAEAPHKKTREEVMKMFQEGTISVEEFRGLLFTAK